MRRSVLLAGLLLLPACGQDVPDERTSQAAPSTSPDPSPTALQTPSPVLSEAAPPAEEASRQPSAVPAPDTTAAPLRPAAQGDVDGDGEPDEVTVGTSLAVRLSGSRRTITSAFQTDAAPQPAGSEDVDRDGRAEVFLRTGQGSSTTFLTPFRYDGRTFAPLTIDGEQAELGVGGSATHGDGFSCTEAGTLVVREASSDDGTTFTVTTTTYRIDGHRLVQTRRTTAQARGMDDPLVGEAYLVDCRSVGEGG